jgi:hypothetical protein
MSSDDEASKILTNFNKANDLSFLKYEIEFKNLIKDLFTEINSLKLNDVNIRLQINNLNHLYKAKQTPDKLLKRLVFDFPKENKTHIEQYNKFIEYLYTFRANRKQLIANYKAEINELISSISFIIEEAVTREIKQLNENIKEFENVNFK